MSRELKSFLIRALLFLLFGRYLFFAIALTLCLFLWFLGFSYFDTYEDYEIIFMINAFSAMTIPAFYLMAKLLGLFASLERLKINILSKVLIVLFLSCTFASLFILEEYFILSAKNGLAFGEYIVKHYYYYFKSPQIICLYISFLFGLFISYLFYRFFAFLTKRFPVPFEKIGYYSSREFWVCLMKRLKNVKRT